MKNIRDLAKITGYSISTISRYINNSGYVSEKASKKIQEAIEKENFHVNNLARTVFTKKSYLIGCVVEHLQNPYYTDFIESLDSELTKEGYQLILSHTNADHERERTVINNLIDLRVDGILIFNGSLDKEFYNNIPINVIAFNKYVSETLPFISTNDEEVGVVAAKYLKDHQAKNPAFVDYTYQTDVGVFRYKGISNEFAKDGIEVKKYYYKNNNFEALANEIYQNGHDGVFFYSDYIAVPTNNYLQKLNESIIVTSCDRIESLKSVAPNIYSVEQDVNTQIDIALRIIKGEETELIHKVSPKKSDKKLS